MDYAKMAASSQAAKEQAQRDEMLILIKTLTEKVDALTVKVDGLAPARKQKE